MNNKKSSKIHVVKKIYKFLKEDSWQSLLVFFILAIVFIKFIFFPTLSYITGSQLPLVIVESCSMYHEEKGFEDIFDRSYETYDKYNIRLTNTREWDFQDGLSKGDVIFVVGPENIEVGDVVIFIGGAPHPIIHRLVNDTNPYATKGDNNNRDGLHQLPYEKAITQEQLIGKAVFKIPHIGWIKLIFFEFTREPEQRGLCKGVN